MGRNLLLLILLLFCGSASRASHIYGGELLYTYVGGDRYKLTLTLYGDCSGSIFPTFNAVTTRPTINIYKDGVIKNTVILKADTMNVDVSPVCPGQRNNTTCNGGTLPGVKKFSYTDTVTISELSADWRFIFAGQLGTTGGGVGAGRSGSMTNVMASATGGTTTQLEARLNNLAGPNSSPRYTTVPTPYYCINLESQYNQGAVDSDGDSLAFQLVPGINAVPANPLASPNVLYIAPATAAKPIITGAGGFSFNPINGQLTIVPNVVQYALVVYEVREYKAGVLVGTSMREMTFIVTDDCEAAPPKLAVENVSGGSVTNGNVINVCKGTPMLSFDIAVNSQAGDTSHITPSSVPATASLVINNNSTINPSVRFSWNTSGLALGVYTFYLIVKDSHCPISTTQTLAYSINVVNEPTIAAAQVSATNCISKAGVHFNTAEGYLPRMLSVTQGSTLISTFVDSTGFIIDSLPAGTYVASVGSDASCRRTVTFTVVDSGKLPQDPVNLSYCLNKPEQPITLAPAGPGAVFTWFSDQNEPFVGPPTVNTSVPGTYTWYVQQLYKVCSSDRVAVTAVVHGLPEIKVASLPPTICLGDTVYLQAKGGEQYAWWPEQIVRLNAMGKPYVLVADPVKLFVKGVDKYGCFNTDSVLYDNIQPCCGFTYPTAFTPNGDGKNDGFRVLTYGNLYDYRLEIFNRWGQRVFLTVDPHFQWDGRKGGVPCDMGTYFFQFSGRCLTGKTEFHKGDVTLIR